MSIKIRITLWYAAFLIALFAAALVFLLATGSRQARATVSARLIAGVDDALSEIELDDGEIEIDDDISFVSHGVYLAVYDENGTLLAGGLPQEFSLLVPLTEQAEPQKVQSGEENWSVYDGAKLVGRELIWVRGVSSLTDAESSVGGLMRLAFIAFPFLLLIAVTGGYFITRHAFLPVKQIAETAERIGESGDLSQRIGLPAGSDEIHSLSKAFDSMFERLETAFLQEKQFTSDASHELRTPAAVIISQCEYALERPEESKAALSVILEQAKKMSKLLSQLLMLARADQTGRTLTLEQLNLSELTEMVALDQAERAAKKGITIHIDQGKDILFRGDELMLMRMLVNLIENAIRYGKPGGNVYVSLEKNEDGIVGCVRDDGVGISESNQKRIFERFFQADPSRNAEGAGLGLSMVQWIAKAHGGSVSVESKLGYGSSFIFSFPA